ncbi:hypothetical protein ES703_85365 [subsurface metagenome]
MHGRGCLVGSPSHHGLRPRSGSPVDGSTLQPAQRGAMHPRWLDRRRGPRRRDMEHDDLGLGHPVQRPFSELLEQHLHSRLADQRHPHHKVQGRRRVKRQHSGPVDDRRRAGPHLELTRCSVQVRPGGPVDERGLQPEQRVPLHKRRHHGIRGRTRRRTLWLDVVQRLLGPHPRLEQRFSRLVPGLLHIHDQVQRVI